MAPRPRDGRDSPPTATGYVPTLDGWRAVAVLGVIVFHFTVPYADIRDAWIWQLLRFGRYGVDIFFAISGFLITSRMADEVRDSGALSLRGFYIRRAFRILPAAFVFLTVACVWALLDDRRVTYPVEWVASALFFRNYVPGNVATGHLWSLSVEEHFYALWPVVFVLLTRRKAYAWVLVGPLAVILWRGVALHHAVPDALDPTRYLRTGFRLDAPLWGAAAALALRNPWMRDALTSGLGRIAWLLAVATFAAGEFMRFELGATLQAAAAPLVLLGTVLRPASWRARILETGVLRWLGRLSYGLYLYQQIFCPWVFGPSYGWVFILPVTCASYYLIERPLLRLGHDLAARRLPGGSGWRAALALAVAAAGTCAVVLGSQHARLRGARVVVYADVYFQGAHAELQAGPHDLAGPGAAFPNDSVSSIRVGEGARAHLCVDVADGRGRGDCWDLTPGEWLPMMGDRDKAVSFIEVAPTR